MQSAAAEFLQRADLAQNDDGWDTLRAGFDLPTMTELFNGLAEQGVICINAAWTFTGTSDLHLGANLRLWRPVVRDVVQQLVQLNPNCVVLTLGRKAFRLFNSRCPAPTHFVHHCHPQKRNLGWFQQPNPLNQVNSHLVEMQEAPIFWLPGLACPLPTYQ
jgi:uracil DNA glycosylase